MEIGKKIGTCSFPADHGNVLEEKQGAVRKIAIFYFTPLRAVARRVYAR
jgi:hypothetical protein